MSIIAGAHTIIYCEDAEKARAFFRDVLGFASVDAGGGWLIFESPPSEIAMHPGGGAGGDRHELFLMCHDIEKTIEELERKGVEFVAPASQQRFGILARFKVPGAGEIGLYEPMHPSPLPEFQLR